jgi:hypothetical protein
VNLKTHSELGGNWTGAASTCWALDHYRIRKKRFRRTISPLYEKHSLRCGSESQSIHSGPNGEADWILMDPDVNFAELWAQFDTLLMGRKTYDAAKSS